MNVSSVASFQASPGLGVYAATKAYVTSLTEALHGEVKGSGVHVTALCPGLTKTEFQDHSNTTGLALEGPRSRMDHGRGGGINRPARRGVEQDDLGARRAVQGRRHGQRPAAAVVHSLGQRRDHPLKYIWCQTPDVRQ